MSDGIQPFCIEIAQADLDYLHDRLAGARWPRRTARRGVDSRRAAFSIHWARPAGRWVVAHAPGLS
jgi:hypothetical protein